MADRYDQTAASMPTELEEIESPRALDTLENWALSPAGKTFIYLFAMGGGAAMAFMGYQRPSDFLFVVGVALAFGGFGAYMMLRERLSSYGYEVHYTRRSKPVPMAEPPQEQIKVNTSRGSYDETKKRRDVRLGYGRNQEFIFTGANLDKLLVWSETDDSIRKIDSAAGNGFNRLPNPIYAENYTNATAALLEWEYIEGNPYRWTQAGIDWLKTAGL